MQATRVRTQARSAPRRCRSWRSRPWRSAAGAARGRARPTAGVAPRTASASPSAMSSTAARSPSPAPRTTRWSDRKGSRSGWSTPRTRATCCSRRWCRGRASARAPARPRTTAPGRSTAASSCATSAARPTRSRSTCACSAPSTSAASPVRRARASCSSGKTCASSCVSPCSARPHGRRPLNCKKSAVYEPFADQGFGAFTSEGARQPGPRSSLCGLTIATGGPRCDFLIDERCLLPYPSSVFLDEDPSTPTGLRVHYDAGLAARERRRHAHRSDRLEHARRLQPGPVDPGPVPRHRQPGRPRGVGRRLPHRLRALARGRPPDSADAGRRRRAHRALRRARRADRRRRAEGAHHPARQAPRRRHALPGRDPRPGRHARHADHAAARLPRAARRDPRRRRRASPAATRARRRSPRAGRRWRTSSLASRRTASRATTCSSPGTSPPPAPRRSPAGWSSIRDQAFALGTPSFTVTSVDTGNPPAAASTRRSSRASRARSRRRCS